MTNLKSYPQIHKACGDNFYRPVMQYVLVTKDNIVASDANIMVVHLTKDIFSKEFIELMPDRFLIYKNDWREICKPHFTINFDNHIIIERIQRVGGYKFKNIYPVYYEADIGNYPDWKRVVENHTKKVKLDEIAINPELFINLKHALHYKGDPEGLRITFYDRYKGYIVTNNLRKCYGLIMPVRMGSTTIK